MNRFSNFQAAAANPTEGSPMEWPEPIQSVQSLAENGLSSLPEGYIKSPLERPSSLENSGGHHTINIPLIDLSGPDDDLRRPETIREMHDACLNWGFFQVSHHKIPVELLHRIQQVWTSFFLLPLDEKLAYANNPNTYEGFGSRVGVDRGMSLDWGDYFFLHVLPSQLRDPGKWPSLPRNCKETVEEFAEAAMELCRRLLKVFSIGLGHRENLLLGAFGGELSASLRVNYYPICPQPELTLGLSPHSDPGAMTVLLPDDRVTGLQVRKGNHWISVVPNPDSLIINIGDQIQVVSNGVYKSVEHRVAVNSRTDRLSIAFFCNPKMDVPVGPAGELVTEDRPALYQPMTYGEYRSYIRQMGPRGKCQMESLSNSSIQPPAHT